MKKNLNCISIALLVLFIITGSVLADLNAGLVAYYPFNSNANDESGNGYDGTVNGATLTSDRFGNENSAYSFDGVDDYVKITPALFNGMSSLSIFAWVNVSQHLDGSSIISAGSTTSNSACWELLHFNRDTILVAQFGIYGYQSKLPSIEDSQWHYVGVTFNGSIAYTYYDGIIIGYEENITGQIVATGDVTIGKRAGGGLQFHGIIDDIRIYNRALNESEIDSLYHEGGWDTGPVAYYPFNGNANDESGNGNNGTVNGASLTSDRFGSENSAYNFDGVDDNIDIGEAPNFIAENSVFTISAWIKPYSYTSTTNRTVIGCEIGNNGYSLYYHYSWGDLCVNTAANGSHTDAFLVDESYTPLDEWNYLVIRWDPDGYYCLYINGEGIDSVETTNWAYYQSFVPSLFIGADQGLTEGASHSTFHGVIDDVCIYSRVVTKSEIDSLYHEGGWDTDPFTKITEGDIVNDVGCSIGCSWGDYDNDGYLDLFVANWEENNFLYRNNCNGTFTKITTGEIVTDGGNSGGCSWGDYDNDGYLDLFVSNWDENNFLYRNNGNGTFTKITTGEIVTDGGTSFGASWGDYDNDGYLDLFVANGGPEVENNFLYKNNGDGTFTKVTTVPIVTDGGQSLSGNWADYDNDGYLDLFVANVDENDFLYNNNGDGTFTRITEGPVVNDMGKSHGGSWGDYDNDGFSDLFVANGGCEVANNCLYKNNGDGTFTKVTTGPIVSDSGSSTGSSWGDYDNDGDLDLFVANSYGMHNFLYENKGDGTFTKITNGLIVSYGGMLCLGDYDNDGDLDLFATQWDQNNHLYANNGNNNNWVNIKCIGVKSNTSAIGAKIRLKANINGSPIWQLREISGQNGMRTQNSLNAEFGLGDATVIDSIIIKWPSGIIQILTDVDLNQFLTITEQSQISVSIDKINVFIGDSVNIPINVDFPSEKLYDSAELTFSGYQNGLEFIGVDTSSSMTGGAGWSNAVNETGDSLIITWFAGAEDISGSGVFCWLKFAVTGEPCNFVPINIESALFNTGGDPVSITNGGVYIKPIPIYGDVDSNGEVQAHDAALILKHVIEVETLDCQGLANADVTLNDTVTALDASIILQYGVGLIDTLPYDTSNGNLLAKGAITMEDGSYVPGQVVEVPLTLSGGSNILSFEGCMSYRPEQLVYNDIEWSQATEGFLIEVNESDGRLVFAGAGSAPDGESGVFATVRFVINASFSGGETTVSLDKLRWNEGAVKNDVAVSTLSRIAAIDLNVSGIPTEYSLSQNYPNPFNPVTTIQYAIPEKSHITLTIYNIAGQALEVLENQSKEPGYYSVQWDASKVGSGVYIYEIKAGEFRSVKKCVILK